jgi:hypothetical protein
MGTYGEYFDRHAGKTPKQIHEARYNHETDERSYRVLQSAWVNFREYYAAVEITEKATGEKTVWCAMDLLYVRREKGGETWMYHKPIGEECGPVDCNCPESILDLLTDPAPNEWAKDWRAKCRMLIAARKTKAALRAGLKKGDKVTFSGTYAGSNVWTVDAIQIGRGNRKTVLFGHGNVGPIRLRGWKSRVVGVEAAA